MRSPYEASLETYAGRRLQSHESYGYLQVQGAMNPALAAQDRTPQSAPASAPQSPPSPSPEGVIAEALRQYALAANRTDEALLRQIVADAFQDGMVPKIEITVNSEPLKMPESGYVRPEFEDLLRRVANKLNVLIVGPAGSGKTHMAQQAAETLSLRFGSISCSGGMSESHLTGWLLPIAAGGSFEYVPSVFVDIYENGGLFLFDEIDAADPNTLLFINQAIANGSFFIPQRHKNPEVKRHPSAVIIAAANTYGTGSDLRYVGRERLDESTLDRFRAGTIEIGYDSKLEGAAVNPQLLQWGRNIRRKISEANLNRVMSTRFLMDATKLMKSGMSLDRVQKTYFCGWRQDEMKKVS